MPNITPFSLISRCVLLVHIYSLSIHFKVTNSFQKPSSATLIGVLKCREAAVMDHNSALELRVRTRNLETSLPYVTSSLDVHGHHSTLHSWARSHPRPLVVLDCITMLCWWLRGRRERNCRCSQRTPE